MTNDERLTPNQIELVAAGLERIVAMIEADAEEFESQPESVREVIVAGIGSGISYEEMAKDRAKGIKGFRAAAAGARMYASVMATNTDGLGELAELYRKLKGP